MGKEIDLKQFIASLIKHGIGDNEAIHSALEDQGFIYMGGAIRERADVLPEKKPIAPVAPKKKRETKVTKTKPKEERTDGRFREGDWILSSTGRLCHVKEVRENGYVVDNNGWTGINNDYHLWTVKDAKAGEILVSDNGEMTCIFKELTGEDTFSSYCYYCDEFNSNGGNHTSEYHPAEKEQCKKFRDEIEKAGYAWDQKTLTLTKREAQFRVGDWVVYDGEVTQISSVEPWKDRFRYWLVCGKVWLSDEGFGGPDYHLWTIDDAKPGDILVAAQNLVFIFCGINPQQPDKVIDYCGVYIQGQNMGNSSPNNIHAKDCLPATEEQRQFLLDRTKKAGYQFNFEKLKLEKLVPDPVFKQGDEIWLEGKTSTIAGIIEVRDDHYVLDNKSTLPFVNQEGWSIVPKLTDFEKAMKEKLKNLINNKGIDLNNPKVIQELSEDILNLVQEEDEW